ncbi:MAG: hypothetical protein RBU25_14020 [Lentisphaeria bacterium]|jgi:KDO2-lipid IV(A) lauroyltransferase|nr:hypothetical protein [Lentisphaeria bacterium]
MSEPKPKSKRKIQPFRQLLDGLAPVAFDAAAFLLGLLGRRGMEGLARQAGWLMPRFRRGTHRLVLENLGLAFPERGAEERERIARESYFNVALNALISLRLVRKPLAAVEDIDISALDQCPAMVRNRTDGAPALVVMSHLGNWELLGLAVSRQGVPVSAIAHPIPNKGIEERVLRTRQTFGLQVVSSRGGVDGLRQAARAGRVLAILMDQKTHISQGGAFADFFGLPVPMTRAPSVLARRLKLPIVAAACVREGGGYRLILEEITGDASQYASDEELLQKLAAANERLIRAYPEQYVWTYRRWRYIPNWADKALAARFPSYARRYSGSSLRPRQR